MYELTKLLKLTEFQLKVKLYKDLKKKKMSPIFKDGFVYAKGDIPILLVAHMDTVLKKAPKKFYYNEKSDKLYSINGIGGDDRCGIYAIMKILEEYRPHVLFTELEEKGGIGAQKAVDQLPKPDVKYIIELDRQGNNDCVFYECGNEEFINYIENFNFVTEIGTFSDISILGSEWDIAAVNISSGYYNEHTKYEYIKFNELQNIITRIKEMLKKYESAKYFDYQEKKYEVEEYDNLFGFDYDLYYRYFVENDYEEKNVKRLTLKKNDKGNNKGN